MTGTKKGTFVLAGDVGGSKTHVGLFSKGKRRPVLKVIETYASREAPDLESIIERFLESHNVSISSACFGVAGPVRNGRSTITNLAWYVSERKLKNRFGLDKVVLINDLMATASAIPLLSRRELFPLNQAKPVKGEALGLIAPGTGLGMALLVPKDGKYFPLPSEGGHADFGPNNETELRLWQYLHQRVGHVSAERVLSGPGLFIIYSWLRYSGQDKEPEWLTEKLNQGDLPKAIAEAALIEREPLCVKTLDLFVSILGAAAGNLALTGLTRGGVYLGGGIVPKILPKLQEDLFIKAFENKGRFKYFMSRIPVRVILNDRAALLGAAVCALEQELEA
ncbi:MAG: glucokinase [Desulfobacterales bacterium]|nr:glucokinase [Desulfobacterales bacterium]